MIKQLKTFLLIIFIIPNFCYSQNWYDDIFFKDKSFTFEFIRALGYSYSGGADVGESIATAREIKDSDTTSWYQEWLQTADRIQKLADEMQANKTSARELNFRASNYYRSAGFYLNAKPDRDKSIQIYKRSKQAFLKAIQGIPYITVVKIPYEKTTLPGYFIQSSLDNAPLLIIQTGFDGTAEELYFEAGKAAHERGYNVLLFEGPGQGEVLRQQKLPFRYDWEKVVTPVIDFAVTLPGIDKNRIALMGISMGGYFAPRAAAFDKRIKATIANSGIYDVYEGLVKNLPAELLDLLKTNPKEFDKIMNESMAKDPGANFYFNHAMWVFNVNNPSEVMNVVKQYTLKDVVSQIKAPILVTTSNEDMFDHGQAKKLYSLLKGPKTLMEFTPEETAQAHCQMGAIAISNEKILNWLDKTFNFNNENKAG